MDNYEKAKKQAEKYFLTQDQEALFRRCPFAYDENYIFVPFLAHDYRICRKTGRVEKSCDGFSTTEDANFEETLSIFDFLFHEGTHKHLSGTWAPVDSLRGRPNTLASMPAFHSALSQMFDRDHAAFHAACQDLGGTAVPMGDIGYKIPVFPNFSVIVKFYAADEDFPAQTVILWDENTLSFLRYETTFYIAGHLLKQLSAPGRFSSQADPHHGKNSP